MRRGEGEHAEGGEEDGRRVLLARNAARPVVGGGEAEDRGGEEGKAGAEETGQDCGRESQVRRHQRRRSQEQPAGSSEGERHPDHGADGVVVGNGAKEQGQ